MLDMPRSMILPCGKHRRNVMKGRITMKEYKVTVEGLWGNIHSGNERYDKRTEIIRQAFCKAERLFDLGVLMTGVIKERSETGHFYNGNEASPSKATEIIAFIENEAKCIITSSASTITGIVFRVW